MVAPSVKSIELDPSIHVVDNRWIQINKKCIYINDLYLFVFELIKDKVKQRIDHYDLSGKQFSSNNKHAGGVALMINTDIKRYFFAILSGIAILIGTINPAGAKGFVHGIVVELDGDEYYLAGASDSAWENASPS